jgi:hypothetical protein
VRLPAETSSGFFLFFLDFLEVLRVRMQYPGLESPGSVPRLRKPDGSSFSERLLPRPEDDCQSPLQHQEQPAPECPQPNGSRRGGMNHRKARFDRNKRSRQEIYASKSKIMRSLCSLLPVLVLGISAVSCGPVAFAQTTSPADSAGARNDTTLPDDPATQTPVNSTTKPSSAEGQQTKRILGIIPNFRSVSVDAKLPPLSPGNKFKLMLQDSFDYSSFIYVGIIAGGAQAQRSYPEFHQGAAGYGRYYWHSFADNLGGNLMTEAIVPTLTREDPRYYTLGRGNFVRRTAYSVSRLFITRTDHDGMSPNVSEIVGNGAAAGIANFYYPSRERTWTKTGQRWLAQIALDGASNLAKEYWPYLNARVFHGKY